MIFLKKTRKDASKAPKEPAIEVPKKGLPKAPEAKDQAKPESTEEQQKMMASLKDIESALFALKFYPVAVKENAKKEASDKLVRMYSESNDTVRQMMLYMIHEALSSSAELKMMHTLDHFKMRNPGVDQSQLRIKVYRAMFNYNTSLEGLTEIIRLLGRFKGGDDAVKLLTYHFSHLCSMENEANHILRGAILETLGESDSGYALYALLEYARYTDNERTFNRIVSALMDWEGRIDKLDLPPSEKNRLKEKLKEIITSDFGGSHYR